MHRTFRTLRVTVGYSRLQRLHPVLNPYLSGYAWLRMWLFRLVYTQVCEHWLFSSYAWLTCGTFETAQTGGPVIPVTFGYSRL